MSDLLPGLLVLAVGGSIAPRLLLLTILFLGSKRPIPNAVALAIGLYAATPRRARTVLGSLQAWMGKHNRTITVVI